MLNKTEQKSILDAIEAVYAVKIEKLTKDKDSAIEQKNVMKEKLSVVEAENKAMKEKVKALEKELSAANKIVAKYDKLVNSLK